MSKVEACRAADRAKADLGKAVTDSLRSGEDAGVGYRKGLTRLSAQLNKIADTTSDPALATALQEVAKVSKTLAATADPMSADSSSFDKAGGKLDALCKGRK